MTTRIPNASRFMLKLSDSIAAFSARGKGSSCQYEVNPPTRRFHPQQQYSQPHGLRPKFVSAPQEPASQSAKASGVLRDAVSHLDSSPDAPLAERRDIRTATRAQLCSSSNDGIAAACGRKARNSHYARGLRASTCRNRLFASDPMDIVVHEYATRLYRRSP